jgi:GH15 family glucan-1,4-alpha-glucosidase
MGVTGKISYEPRPHVLREYALLADGERGAIVGPRGEFAFMCFPTWSDEALFATLIGGSGTYSVTPAGRFVWGGYYEPGSLIWRSRWATETGIIECREALALPSQAGRAVILRRVIAVRGPARVEVLLNPRGGFGAEGLRGLRQAEDEVWRGRIGELALAWQGAPQAKADGYRGGGLALEFELDPGRHRDFVLVVTVGGEAQSPPDPEAAWAGTVAEWSARVPPLDESLAPRDARHAYAVLTGLTSSSGGMVAAATTSLPERAERGRNYDYRYVWIRDQCYVGESVARDGPHRLLDDALHFVRERLLDHGPAMRPAYTTTGGRVPDERRLDLPGYPGGGDIVGNWVNEQFQLDAFGEALLLFAAGGRHDHLGAEDWRAVEIAVEAIRSRWQEPDAGVWELDPAPWTHSRLICAAGLRAISTESLAAQQAADWEALADAIVAHTARRGIHPTGRWQRAETDERVDAALLMPTVRGAFLASDPRSLATLDAVVHELTEDGYAYRFRTDERPLGEAEGAFLLCGFWLALAFAQQGDRLAATRWFERSRAACGSPGLLTEEFDVRQRQLRGNLPQAFVHALLLESSVTLARL